MLLSGYLNYRFTGRFVDSIASQVGYVPFDYKRPLGTAARLEVAGAAHHVRHAARAGGGGHGHWRSEPTGRTGHGHPAGLKCWQARQTRPGSAGRRCLTPEIACLSYGTAATINTTTPRYLEATPFIPPYQAAVPGHYNTEVQITRGFWMVNWFKEQFGLHEQQQALQRRRDAREPVRRPGGRVPPGAQGLMLQPFWNPGIKVPGPEAKGAVIGFGDVHTRAHLYRAILEGLAYALREAKERIERRGGAPITLVRVSGGGSQSDAAMQITANIFNLPCERPHFVRDQRPGRRHDCRRGPGLARRLRTAVAAMARMGDRFEPEADARRTPTTSSTGASTAACTSACSPLYRDIRAITGYPSH